MVNVAVAYHFTAIQSPEIPKSKQELTGHTEKKTQKRLREEDEMLNK